jgi:uncharacterized protein YgbK (DUF1537 family)
VTGIAHRHIREVGSLRIMRREWLVAADDRTGAMEVAAELATADLPVIVTVAAAPASNGVVDLGTRLLSPDRAAAAVRALPRASWEAHKIDSTLRGNWADEIRARGRRTLIVPGWPAMGRTCEGGVVHVHGAPVAAIRDRLPEAVLLGGVDALAAWLASGDGVAAVDVADTAALRLVASVAAAADVLVAGPAGAIGAVFRARSDQPRLAEPPPLAAPITVVCGSATAVSREQVRRLRIARPDVRIEQPPPVDGELTPEVVRQLVAGLDVHSVGTLVVVGGDTTAALLGDRPRLVGGYAAPGMPWSVDEHGVGAVVVTKAGGFGGPDALVDLFSVDRAGPRTRRG